MAQPQLSAAQIMQTNAEFLAMANWRPALMDSTTGIYKTGQTTTFTMDPTGGYARAIWVMGKVDVTPAGTGTIGVSPYAPYVLFNRVRVRLGNLIHDVHPYAFALMQQLGNNAGQDFLYPGVQPQLWAQNVLFGSLQNGTASWAMQGVNAETNVWTFMFRIPLQFEKDDVTGIVPLGASSNKLTLELDPTTSPIGTDPLVSPILQLTGANTVTIGTTDNTLTAVVEYADMNTLQGPTGGGFVVPDPIITQAVYLRDNVTPYPKFGSYLYAYMEEPYVFMRLIAMMNDNYTAVNGTGNNALAMSQNALLTGIRLNYDGQNTAREWDATSGGTNTFWMEQLVKYGTLFNQGIIPFDFTSGQDPRHPNGQDLLNAANFTQARIGLQYTSPGAGVTGAYIRLIGQYLVPQSYGA